MKNKFIFLVAAISLSLSACGGGSGAVSSIGSGGGTAGGGVSTFSIPGTVTKGPMTKSTIRVMELPLALGPKAYPVYNKQVGSGISNNGSVTLSINTTSKNKITVAISDAGSYVDEATGKLVSFATGQGFHAFILPGDQSVTISPLSEIAYRVAIQAWSAGMPTKTAIMKGRGFVLRMFGVHPNATPDNPLKMKNLSLEAMEYAGILAGFSQILQNPTLKALRSTTSSDYDFYQAMISDMADGTIDGKKGTAPIVIPGLKSFLPALGGITFKNAIMTFIASHPNFNPKAKNIPFKAPTAVSQPVNPKYGSLTVTGIPNTGIGCATASTTGCSTGVFIPVVEMIPAKATFASLPADPKQFNITFDLPGLFTMAMSSTAILTNYIQSAYVKVSRYDVNGKSVWSTTSGKSLLARGIAVDVKARTVTFTNAKMYYLKDALPQMDTIVLNGVLRF